MDSISALNVAQDRIIGMIEQNLEFRQKRTRSPVVPSGLEGSATFVRDKPTRVEHRYSAFVKGPRSQSPLYLRITPVELDSKRLAEAPQFKKREESLPADVVTLTEGPTSSVTIKTDRIPEPKPVCTSTKRDIVNYLLESCEPTASSPAAVPGTEVA